jgi:hypothetical protein
MKTGHAGKIIFCFLVVHKKHDKKSSKKKHVDFFKGQQMNVRMAAGAGHLIRSVRWTSKPVY